jgi:hypothetical protein
MPPRRARHTGLPLPITPTPVGASPRVPTVVGPGPSVIAGADGDERRTRTPSGEAIAYGEIVGGRADTVCRAAGWLRQRP